MRYYSEEKLTYYKHQARLNIIASIFFIFVAIAFFTITAFFINDNNIIAIKVIDAILLSFSICFLFYSIVNVINPAKRKINHIFTILNSSTKQIRCEILDIKDIKTISKDVVAKQLFVRTEDELELFINYNLDCIARDFHIGDIIEVDVSNTFIINEENQDNE